LIVAIALARACKRVRRAGQFESIVISLVSSSPFALHYALRRLARGLRRNVRYRLGFGQYTDGGVGCHTLLPTASATAAHF
jgi:hypothetical protein